MKLIRFFFKRKKNISNLNIRKNFLNLLRIFFQVKLLKMMVHFIFILECSLDTKDFILCIMLAFTQIRFNELKSGWKFVNFKLKYL